PFLTLVVLALGSLASSSVVRAQGTHRTPDGHPDLQGTWVNNTATPLERPRDMADREFFTDAEAKTYEQRYQLDRTARPHRSQGGTGDCRRSRHLRARTDSPEPP